MLLIRLTASKRQERSALLTLFLPCHHLTNANKYMQSPFADDSKSRTFFFSFFLFPLSFYFFLFVLFLLFFHSFYSAFSKPESTFDLLGFILFQRSAFFVLCAKIQHGHIFIHQWATKAHMISSSFLASLHHWAAQPQDPSAALLLAHASCPEQPYNAICFPCQQKGTFHNLRLRSANERHISRFSACPKQQNSYKTAKHFPQQPMGVRSHFTTELGSIKQTEKQQGKIHVKRTHAHRCTLKPWKNHPDE